MVKKAQLGNKIRRLRQDRALTQQQMAEQLAISPSYLNLIEHNQRPVTVGLLLKLGQTFDVDLQELSDDEERRLVVALREVFADGTLHAHEVGPDDIGGLVGASPAAAKAIIELYRAYKTAREDAQSLVLGLSGGSGSTGTKRLMLPTEEARDFFHDRTNHFPTLEAAAERLWREAPLDPIDPARGLVERVAARHGITVEVAPQDRMAGALRRFDPHAKRLTLSEVLPRTSRNFQIAYQLGLIEAKAEIDAIVTGAHLSSRETETLCRVGLANYFAGAVLMPYARFLAMAKEVRYDIEVLVQRTQASFEQVCHRLSTLQRPGAKGVPFYLVRVDVAGNISKRFSASGFHFSRFGGSCPRWIVHEAFTTPGMIRTQIARLPDGSTFFCLARTLAKGAAGFHEPHSQLAVGIGCDLSHAREIVYADGYDLDRLEMVTEIGVGCRLCERDNCRQRAFPPLQHRLMVDEKVRRVSPYAFGPEG
jgi:predicted transcriptional regulator/transcriptional regulator with XRE-family HTH domain